LSKAGQKVNLSVFRAGETLFILCLSTLLSALCAVIDTPHALMNDLCVVLDDQNNEMAALNALLSAGTQF
jgi:hypothetical protein